jgi:hypothetical protein
MQSDKRRRKIRIAVGIIDRVPRPGTGWNRPQIQKGLATVLDDVRSLMNNCLPLLGGSSGSRMNSMTVLLQMLTNVRTQGRIEEIEWEEQTQGAP